MILSKTLYFTLEKLYDGHVISKNNDGATCLYSIESRYWHAAHQILKSGIINDLFMFRLVKTYSTHDGKKIFYKINKRGEDLIKNRIPIINEDHVVL